jgi:hypothetical protein
MKHLIPVTAFFVILATGVPAQMRIISNPYATPAGAGGSAPAQQAQIGDSYDIIACRRLKLLTPGGDPSRTLECRQGPDFNAGRCAELKRQRDDCAAHGAW